MRKLSITKTSYLRVANILIKKLNNTEVHLFALCLYNSGSTSTLLNEQAIPQGIIAKIGLPQTFTTTQGIYKTNKFFIAEGIFFLDFCKSWQIPPVHMRTFNSPNSRYDIIVGRDVLAQGFILNHCDHTITWDGLTVPMHQTSTIASLVPTIFSCAHMAAEVYAGQASTILHAKYNRTSPTDVPNKCNHLLKQDQDKLLKVLEQFPRLFLAPLVDMFTKKFLYI